MKLSRWAVIFVAVSITSADASDAPRVECGGRVAAIVDYPPSIRPRRAGQTCIGRYEVTVRFDIADGATSNISVIKSHPDACLDAGAEKVVRYWRFESGTYANGCTSLVVYDWSE